MEKKIESRLYEMRFELSQKQAEWERMADKNEWDKMGYLSIQIAMLKFSIKEFEKILK